MSLLQTGGRNAASFSLIQFSTFTIILETSGFTAAAEAAATASKQHRLLLKVQNTEVGEELADG